MGWWRQVRQSEAENVATNPEDHKNALHFN